MQLAPRLLSVQHSLLVLHPPRRASSQDWNLDVWERRGTRGELARKVTFRSRLWRLSALSLSFSDLSCPKFGFGSDPCVCKMHSFHTRLLFCNSGYLSYLKPPCSFTTHALLNPNVDCSSGLDEQLSDKRVGSLAIRSSALPYSPYHVDSKEFSNGEDEVKSNRSAFVQNYENSSRNDPSVSHSPKHETENSTETLNEALSSERNISVEANQESSSSQLNAINVKEDLRRKRISQANKGRVPWNKGKTWGEETKAKIKERTILAMMDPEIRRKLKENVRPQSEETKLKIQAKLKEVWSLRNREKNLEKAWRNAIAQAARDQKQKEIESLKEAQLKKKEEKERRKAMRMENSEDGEIIRRVPRSEEHRKKISDAIKSKWNDPEYRSKVSKGILTGEKTKKCSVAKERVRVKPIPIIMNENADKEFVAAVMAGEQSHTRDERSKMDPSLKLKKVKIISRAQAMEDASEKDDKIVKQEQEMDSLSEIEEHGVGTKTLHELRETKEAHELKRTKKVVKSASENEPRVEVEKRKKNKNGDEIILQKWRLLENHKKAMEQKKIELLIKAKMLIQEAERAASTMEKTFGSDDVVNKELNQTKDLIEEMEQSMVAGNEPWMDPLLPSSVNGSSVSFSPSSSSSSLISPPSSPVAPPTSPSFSDSESTSTSVSPSPPLESSTSSSFSTLPSPAYSKSLQDSFAHEVWSEEEDDYVDKEYDEGSDNGDEIESPFTNLRNSLHGKNLSEKIKSWSDQLNTNSFDIQTKNFELDPFSFKSLEQTNGAANSKENKSKLDLYFSRYYASEDDEEKDKYEPSQEYEKDYKEIDYENFFKLYAKSMAENLWKHEKSDEKRVNGFKEEIFDDESNYEDEMDLDGNIHFYEELEDQGEHNSFKQSINKKLDDEKTKLSKEFNYFREELSQLDSEFNADSEMKLDDDVVDDGDRILYTDRLPAPPTHQHQSKSLTGLSKLGEEEEGKSRIYINGYKNPNIHIRDSKKPDSLLGYRGTDNEKEEHEEEREKKVENSDENGIGQMDDGDDLRIISTHPPNQDPIRLLHDVRNRSGTVKRKKWVNGKLVVLD